MAADAQPKPSRYAALVEAVFLASYSPGARCVQLTADAFAEHAQRLGISVKTFSSLVYEFRHGRSELPAAVREVAPTNTEWVIEVATNGYRARAVPSLCLPPHHEVALTRLSDRTPGEHLAYGRRDEQWVISRLQHNQIFSHFLAGRITLLQHRTRTSNGSGQIEIDALMLAQGVGQADALCRCRPSAGVAADRCRRRYAKTLPSVGMPTPTSLYGRLASRNSVRTGTCCGSLSCHATG